MASPKARTVTRRERLEQLFGRFPPTASVNTSHSTATYLKGLGADDRLLASIMGHTDARSVEKYAKVQGQTIRTALARLKPKR